MEKPSLILDCDGVLYDSTPIIDEQVQKINYYASDKYGAELKRRSMEIDARRYELEEERSDYYSKEMVDLRRQADELAKLRKMHFDLKDLVLEEVLSEYRGLINYNIYNYETAFLDAMEEITRIWERRVYEEIIVLSHVNQEREVVYKYYALKRDLPMAEFIPVKFHFLPYYNPETGMKNEGRQRSNKIIYLQNQKGNKSFSTSTFIDDTSNIVDEAKEAGIRFCYHKGMDDTTKDLLKRAYIDTLYGYDRSDMKNKVRVKKIF